MGIDLSILGQKPKKDNKSTPATGIGTTILGQEVVQDTPENRQTRQEVMESYRFWGFDKSLERGSQLQAEREEEAARAKAERDAALAQQEKELQRQRQAQLQADLKAQRYGQQRKTLEGLESVDAQEGDPEVIKGAGDKLIPSAGGRRGGRRLSAVLGIR